MQIKPNKFQSGVLQSYGFSNEVYSKKYSWYMNICVKEHLAKLNAQEYSYTVDINGNKI